MYTHKTDFKRSLVNAVEDLDEKIKIFSSDISTLRQAQSDDTLIRSLKNLSIQFEFGVRRFGESVDIFSAEEDPFIDTFTELINGFAIKLNVIERMIDQVLPLQNIAVTALRNPDQPALPQLLEDRIRQFNSLVETFGNDLAAATGLPLTEREDLIKSFEDLVESLERLIRSDQEVTSAQADLAFASANAAIKITKSFEELLKSFEDLAESRQDLRNKRLTQQEALRKSQEDLIKSFEDLAGSNLALLAAPIQKQQELIEHLGGLVETLEKLITEVDVMKIPATAHITVVR